MSTTRDNTWNLEEGLGKLRWKDGLEDVSALFPHARRVPGREYVHPDSGRAFTVGDRLVVERFVELAPGFPVTASIGFGDEGVDEVAIQSKLPDENDARDALADALSEFLERLGLEPPEPADDSEEGTGEQSWDLPALEVELVFDPDRFELTFSRF